LLIKEKIKQVILLLRKEFPGYEPKPSKSDPLDVLIATMLSQNTTDKTSYRAFKNIKDNIGSWEDVIVTPLARLRKEIRVCGLANQKAVNIKKLLAGLQKERGRLSLNYIKKMSDGEIFDELLRFDGIGVKTISCVLAFGLGRDIFPVDTHVHRLSNRLGFVNTKTAEKTFEQAKKIIPAGKKFLLHTLLIKFGRKVCRSNNPLCGKCVLYDLCEFKDKEKYFITGVSEPKENNFIILEHVA
jgi:endonuclease-3